jgi:hypothetical protein
LDHVKLTEEATIVLQKIVDVGENVQEELVQPVKRDNGWLGYSERLDVNLVA